MQFAEVALAGMRSRLLEGVDAIVAAKVQEASREMENLRVERANFEQFRAEKEAQQKVSAENLDEREDRLKLREAELAADRELQVWTLEKEARTCREALQPEREAHQEMLRADRE